MTTDHMARLRVAVGWVVVGVWLGSLVVDVVVPGYDPPATVHLLMMIVAGALFGPTIAGRG